MLKVPFKRFWKWVGRALLFLGSWVKRLLIFGLFWIGLIGVPDDLAKWQILIEQTIIDPHFLTLAEKALGLASLLELWWVRGLLVLLGIISILWAWRPFGKLRHKIGFRWRRLLANQVWIAQDAAINVLKRSAWGMLKEPNVVKSVSVFDSFTSPFTKEEVRYGKSDVEKALLKYSMFLERTLDRFCDSNPKACRINDGARQIDEVALNQFLKFAIDTELVEEFGEIPDFNVT